MATGGEAPVPEPVTQGPAFAHRRATDPPTGDGLGNSKYAVFTRNGVVVGTVSVAVITGASVFVLVINFLLNNAKETAKHERDKTEQEIRLKEKELDLKRAVEEANEKRRELERKETSERILQQWKAMGDMNEKNTNAMRGVEKAVTDLAVTGKESHVIMNSTASKIDEAAKSLKEAADAIKKAK